MSDSTKRITWPAFAGLAILGALAAPAHAQRRQPQVGFRYNQPTVIPYPVNPNGFTGAYPTAQQQVFNARTLGRSLAAIPPYAYGYNPYPSPIISTGPVVPTGGGGYPPYPAYSSPYATLSTSPYAPGGYGSGGSTLSSGGGYSLSTTGGYSDPYSYGYGGYGGGYGPGSSLQGLASLNSSLGQQQIQVMQSRLLQEQVRQANIDTTIKRMKAMAEIERMRPTAQQQRDAIWKTDVDRARNDPPAPEVWSGKTLNDLLTSIKKAGRNRLKEGPQIDLSDVSLENVNLTDGTNQGNVGLLKAEDDEHRLVLNWPQAFSGPAYADTAKALTKSLGEAVAALKRKKQPEATTLKDVRNNFKLLSDKITETGGTDDLTPSQYIEARRYLRQLEQAIRALDDAKKAAKYFDDWKPKGKTVAELVDHMMANGLEFAPAASGDEAAYGALYQALRAYEGGLNQAMKVSDK